MAKKPVVKKKSDRHEPDTVSMTLYVPKAVHMKMKVAAAKKGIGLYEMLVELFDNTF